MAGKTHDIPRVTGLLIIEARNSNPNGDPDRESDPRTRAHDGKGIVSDVSYKRKLRDLVWNGPSLPAWPLSASEAPKDFGDEYAKGRTPVWREVSAGMGGLEPSEYQIYVCRGQTYKEPADDSEFLEFKRRFWDCRVFGNTVIEREVKDKSKPSGRFIRNGAIGFGVGVSIAKVRIVRDTNTNKAAVQVGKDRGMAPLGFRVIEHGVYAMPFFINPTAAEKSGCTSKDVELLCRLIPYAYPHNASRIRPFVEVRHAWYFEHMSALGSCSDFAVIDALTPTKPVPEEPSSSWADYQYKAKDIAASVEKDFKDKFLNFGDLCDPAFVERLFSRSNG